MDEQQRAMAVFKGMYLAGMMGMRFGMWSDEKALIEALISMARSRVTHEGDFLQQWRNYAHGANPDPLTEEEALAALDWLEERLDMPVNPDA